MREWLTWHRFFGLVVCASIGVVGAGAFQSRTYVGAKKCAECHAGELVGDQYGKWASLRHAKSPASLSGPCAFYAANAAGVKEPPGDPKCLRCHAPLFEKSPGFAGEGITCEVCHGPGSDYAKNSVMTDKKLAKANGLILHDTSLNVIMAYCLDCHNTPHGNPLEFSGAWEKIKHPRPNKINRSQVTQLPNLNSGVE